MTMATTKNPSDALLTHASHRRLEWRSDKSISFYHPNVVNIAFYAHNPYTSSTAKSTTTCGEILEKFAAKNEYRSSLHELAL